MFLLVDFKRRKTRNAGENPGLQTEQVQGAEVYSFFFQHIWKKLFELEFVFFYLFNIYIYMKKFVGA